MRYEPPADDPEASFGGRQHSEHAHFRTKIALAKEKGAVAVLMVNPPLDEDQEDDLDELAFDGSGPRRAFGLPFLQITRKAADRLGTTQFDEPSDKRLTIASPAMPRLAR